MTPKRVSSTEESIKGFAFRIFSFEVSVIRDECECIFLSFLSVDQDVNAEKSRTQMVNYKDFISTESDQICRHCLCYPIRAVLSGLPVFKAQCTTDVR